MSEKNIYVAISYRKTQYEIYKEFIDENRNSLPGSLVSRAKEVDSLDISEYSKLNELNLAFQKYKMGLSRDNEMKFNNMLKNFFIEHVKELDRTRIAKIPVDSLKLEKSADIEGKLLNQFSMDEYNNYLRVAVTRGGSRDNSDNILYIFDSSLNKIGETDKFGTSERIYSVRFVKNTAYVVTYKAIDPFFIMDLSDPKNPEIKGELKIPGFSSYLHPINDNLILGIGREGTNIKVSLFDVSNIENPEEISKYALDEYWSDIINNHHAFLLDKKHKVFFLPGSKGAYIFSYDNDKLQLVKTISERSVKRAIYINDYMYILSYSNIIVVNENSWNRVNELDLNNE